jgi:hypothetical protein
MTVQEQLDKSNMKRVQLEELLHVADEQLKQACAAPAAMQSSSVRRREKRGIIVLDLQKELGLPVWIPEPTQKLIFRKIRAMTTGLDPLLVHAELNATLRDNQALPSDPHSLKNVILRATRTHQGIPAQDCIKVLIENNSTASSVYFALCMAFLKDAAGENFVIVRWFENQDANGFDPITHVPSFKLEPETRTDSYCVLPAYSILNGAVMFPANDNRYWELLSPNEEKEYAVQFRTE